MAAGRVKKQKKNRTALLDSLFGWHIMDLLFSVRMSFFLIFFSLCMWSWSIQSSARLLCVSRCFVHIEINLMEYLLFFMLSASFFPYRFLVFLFPCVLFARCCSRIYVFSAANSVRIKCYRSRVFVWVVLHWRSSRPALSDVSCLFIRNHMCFTHDFRVKWWKLL